MPGRLDGRKVVVLLAEGFEDLEFWVTVMRLREEGAAVTIAGLSTEPVRGKNGLEAHADVLVADVKSTGVDAVVVPGGWAPDKLRRYEAVTGLRARRSRGRRDRRADLPRRDWWASPQGS